MPLHNILHKTIQSSVMYHYGSYDTAWCYAIGLCYIVLTYTFSTYSYFCYSHFCC